jgi:D-alanyl-D-alanine carboxypeptidase
MSWDQAVFMGITSSEGKVTAYIRQQYVGAKENIYVVDTSDPSLRYAPKTNTITVPAGNNSFATTFVL